MRDFAWQSTHPGLAAQGQLADALGRWRGRFLRLIAGLGALFLAAGLLGEVGLPPVPPALAEGAELLALAITGAGFVPVWSARDPELRRRLLILGCALAGAALFGGAGRLAGVALAPADAAALAVLSRGAVAAGLAAAVLLPAAAGVAPGERWVWLGAVLAAGATGLGVHWLDLDRAGWPGPGEILVPVYGLLALILGRRVLADGRAGRVDRLLLAAVTTLLFAEFCFLVPGNGAENLLGQACRILGGLMLFRLLVAACLREPLRDAQVVATRFRQLLDAAPDSMLIVDARGRIAGANVRTEGLFRCRREQLLGQPVELLIPAELRNTHEAHRAAFSMSPRLREMGSGLELVAARLDGTIFPAEVSLSPMVTAGQRWVMCVIRDITRRREAERDLRQREQELRLLMESSPDLVLLVGADLRLRYANPAVARVAGRRVEHYLGGTLDRLFPGPGAPLMADRLAATVGSATATSFEFSSGASRTERQYLIRMVPEVDEGGGVECVIVVATDISDLVGAREENRRLAAILEAIPDLVSITTASGELAYLNPAGRRMLEEAVPDGDDELFRSHCHPQWASRRLLEEGVPEALRGGVWRGESAILRRGGDELPVMQTLVAHRAEDGRVLYWSSIIQDFSARKQLEEQLLHLATHDVLTALPNRALFLDRLRQAVHHAQRAGRMAAVLFMDLDDFKTINDTLGHTCGDALLEQVARRLRDCLRAGDTVGRLGGDEFALIVEGVDQAADVAGVADKLLALLRTPYELQGRLVSVSSSIGITLYPGDDQEPMALLRKADIAMYQAKQAGRSGYMFYTAEMDSHMQERLELREDLRRAVERGELLLHYQPKVNLASGRICGMEALVRWQHPLRGLIPPAVFIPIAEASDLIVAVDLWVLEAACAQNQAWQDQGLPPLRVAVNLSARQFADGELVNNVARILAATRLAPEYLELEITESRVMERPDQSLATLHALKELGVHLAIDDFGTGYSSLSYLRSFPVNMVKIDRSFVIEAPVDANDAAIASAIISMAHRLGLGVVAEGVESHAHVEFLRHHHCDDIQGYFISHPLPPEEFARFLKPAPGVAMPVVRGAARVPLPAPESADRHRAGRSYPED